MAYDEVNRSFVLFSLILGIMGCKFPGHQKNGRLNGDWANRQEGSSLRLVCDEGYELKGTIEIVCKNGKWTATLGTCEGLKNYDTVYDLLSAHDGEILQITAVVIISEFYLILAIPLRGRIGRGVVNPLNFVELPYSEGRRKH